MTKAGSRPVALDELAALVEISELVEELTSPPPPPPPLPPVSCVLSVAPVEGEEVAGVLPLLLVYVLVREAGSELTRRRDMPRGEPKMMGAGSDEGRASLPATIARVPKMMLSVWIRIVQGSIYDDAVKRSEESRSSAPRRVIPLLADLVDPIWRHHCRPTAATGETVRALPTMIRVVCSATKRGTGRGAWTECSPGALGVRWAYRSA